jgi:hypothetical protein
METATHEIWNVTKARLSQAAKHKKIIMRPPGHKAGIIETHGDPANPGALGRMPSRADAQPERSPEAPQYVLMASAPFGLPTCTEIRPAP